MIKVFAKVGTDEKVAISSDVGVNDTQIINNLEYLEKGSWYFLEEVRSYEYVKFRDGLIFKKENIKRNQNENCSSIHSLIT